ncbi:MAG: replicative DNA helicase, partial [Clostridia bacterium]|nr:replicative DNA helicase [Clostridia bacterium]
MPENDLITLNGVEMPWSAEAEQAVLGCILRDPACLSSVMVHINSPDYFYRPQHQSIYKVMMSLEAENKNIDVLVVLDILVADKVFDGASGREYLFNLAKAVPSTENAEAYAKIVKEKYYLRTLITICSDTMEKASDQDTPIDTLLDDVEQKIYNLRQGKAKDEPEKLYDIAIGSVFESIKNLTGSDKELYKGYTTGF